MKRSLFSKIFVVQLISALTTILLIIPMIFILVGNYFVGAQKDDILEDAMRVSSLTEKASEFGESENILQFYRMGIEYIGRQSRIFVVKADGQVLFAPPDTEGINIKYIDRDFIKPALGSESKNVVKFYNKGRIFSQETLVALSPIYQRSSLGGEKTCIGVTVALRFMPQIKYVQHKILEIILFAQLIAWLIAFVVSYIFTRQITKPIKKMRNAAKSIASGNFNERIPITSNDEISQLAQSFNQMTESLSELEKMRSSFISDVSHELRTPMTVIGGFVGGIVDGTIPHEQQDKYLRIVLDETKRLSRLVNDLLESSRLEQGRIVLNKSDFDLNRLVTECVFSYEQRISEKHIDLDLSLEGNELAAFADKDHIKRVVINLIDNAIKFTPEGGKIMVRTELVEKKVVTSIENTGDGIPPNDLKHIWERFYKTDKSRGVDKKGVGLGLYIAKSIITQHGGEIMCESVEKKYTKFTFTLDKGKARIRKENDYE